MNYKVGQIIYVVFSNDRSVTPLQVIEEITRKTLDGLKIDYLLRKGPDDTVSFEEIDGEIFDTPEIAIEVLSDKAKKSITALVNGAVERSKLWYSEKPEMVVETVVENIDDKSVIKEPQKQDDEVVKVKLPDGSYANVKFPTVA